MPGIAMNEVPQHHVLAATCLQPVSCTLQDGLEVTIRGVLPEDRQHFHAGMRALSARSRYFRFNSYRSKLTEPQISYLTEIDQVNHVALCVFRRMENKEVGIGVGRFIRQPADMQRAELALTVIDAYQQHGVGTLLLTALNKIAALHGISSFTLRIHANRFALVKRLKTLDARVLSHQRGVLEMELPVAKQQQLKQNLDPQLYQLYQAFSA